MSGAGNSTSRELEELVAKSGCQKKILLDPDLVVCDDEWSEEREQLAKERIENDTALVPKFWQNKYEMEAAKNWDKFYKRNSCNFYKNRHYLDIVFPELGMRKDQYLLEIGCGVGNAALPLLESNPNLNILAVDFAESALELLKTQPLYDSSRCFIHQCDITQDPLNDFVSQHCTYGANLALLFFCLSAIHPEKMRAAAQNIYEALQTGGKLFFRDYGRYDQAQLRFKLGHKLEDNFYVRQDNTRAYYFTTEELAKIFGDVGFKIVENHYIRRQYVNRKQNIVRFRVWVHAVFQK